jgi:transcriptional regulator with XRE-family HTH domain
MTDESGSTVARRQLGRSLRQLRERAHISQDHAAVALDCSRQKIWRLESGATPVRASDVKVLCNLYRAGPEVTRALAALALQTRSKGWWHAYGDAVPPWFSLYVGLESAAGRLRYYGGELVPRILQTRRYALAVLAARRLSEAERDRAVSVLQRRQELLDRRVPAPPRVEVVLSEAALRRPIADPEGMLEQLRHLLRTAELPHVSLRVLPLDTGPTLAGEAGPFVILDFLDSDGRPQAEPTTVYTESLTAGLYLDKPADVQRYEEAWADLAELALDGEASRSLLDRLVGQRV